MSTGFPINPPNAPVVMADGRCTTEWYRFFLAIQKMIGGPSDPFDNATLAAYQAPVSPVSGDAVEPAANLAEDAFVLRRFVDDLLQAPVPQPSAPVTYVGIASGTSFPGSPTGGDRFYRSDRNVEYFYDGTRWLSTTLYSVQLDIQEGSIMPLTATNAMWASNPFSGIHDIWLEKGLVGFNQSAGTTSTNYFTAQFQSRLGAATTNIGGTVSSQGTTLLQWSMASVTLNASVASSAAMLSVQFTETGTATCFMAPSLTYRLLG